MRKSFLVATAAMSMFAMGCPSPESVCQTKAEVSCKKIFECAPDQIKALYGANATECQPKMEETLKCSTIEKYDDMCTDGKEYSLGKASDCSDETEKQACADFNASLTDSTKKPAVCAEVCK